VDRGEFTLKPLLRMRSYIRLARDFEAAEARTIKGPAVDRAIRCLKEFKRISEAFDPSYLPGGGHRSRERGGNRDDVIRTNPAETNLPVRLLSGEEEAKADGSGGQPIRGCGEQASFVIFDLGGGSTEFLLAGQAKPHGPIGPSGSGPSDREIPGFRPAPRRRVGRAKARVIELLEQGWR
jgi:exopolyphosphatase/pppGpp-phosphohydrolase